MTSFSKVIYDDIHCNCELTPTDLLHLPTTRSVTILEFILLHHVNRRMYQNHPFQIRFFGGTHERMLAKRSDTRPFHLPADEVGVLRRTSTSGGFSGGSFERAWNEVLKLQANIDTGYYTHSSGESDLPSSDEDYSDELYLGPRRGPVHNNNNHHHHHSAAARADSPISSLASSTFKLTKRK